MNCSSCGKTIGRYGKTGLCLDCWHQYNRGKNASNWRGGIFPYKLIKGFILEHRFIWEQAYGKLPKGWVVHHINGEKKDNRLSNLLAMPAGEHRSAHGLTERLKRGQIKRIYRELFTSERETKKGDIYGNTNKAPVD